MQILVSHKFEETKIVRTRLPLTTPIYPPATTSWKLIVKMFFVCLCVRACMDAYVCVCVCTHLCVCVVSNLRIYM